MAASTGGEMKARIVNLDDVRKTPEEREAEGLLGQLEPGKAVEITLDERERPKNIARLYRIAARRLRKYIRIETIDGGAKLLVYLKSEVQDDDDDDDD